uniref:Uncharacterized protein n=1 Tax=Anguilla anguilla TaxID=7936 RepID=A0A0E9VJX5_ANGAN
MEAWRKVFVTCA